MINIIIVGLLSFFLFYKSFLVIHVINDLDSDRFNNPIQYKESYILFEVIMHAIFAVILYIKFKYSIELFAFLILIDFTMIAGYIDKESTDVYSLCSFVMGIIGILLVILRIFSGNLTLYNVGWIIIGVAVSGFLTLVRCFSFGDFEVFSVISLTLASNIILPFIFFSLFISCSSPLYKIFMNKPVKRNNPLIPYIDLALLFTILFI